MEPAQITPASAPDPGPEPPARSAPRRRRTARTLGLIAVAAVIGLVGGYGIQADREPTPLTPLNQPGLAYPKPLPKGQKQKPPLASEDRQAKAQGDLRKLLLPAPAGATADPKLNGGWVGVDSHLAVLAERDRRELKEYLADSALRHVAARGWTTPDGTTTRIHLLRFSSVAFSEAYRDEVTDGLFRGERLPVGVESAVLDQSTQDVDVPNVAPYAYQEEEPYGPEQTRWSFVQAGDTLAVITQSRKEGVLTVPFQQTVALQAQLLG